MARTDPQVLLGNEYELSHLESLIRVEEHRSKVYASHAYLEAAYGVNNIPASLARAGYYASQSCLEFLITMRLYATDNNRDIWSKHLAMNLCEVLKVMPRRLNEMIESSKNELAPDSQAAKIILPLLAKIRSDYHTASKSITSDKELRTVVTEVRNSIAAHQTGKNGDGIHELVRWTTMMSGYSDDIDVDVVYMAKGTREAITKLLTALSDVLCSLHVVSGVLVKGGGLTFVTFGTFMGEHIDLNPYNPEPPRLLRSPEFSCP